MNTDGDALRQRVAALPAERRVVLAQRLGVATPGRSKGGARLIAYIVPRTDGHPPAELRAFLKQRLPDHMIPAAFVTLERLPRTPNGKVDAAALPAPDEAATAAPAVFVAPASVIEQTLAGIWSEVLGGIRVGVHDNFFEIGGDSILSIQVVAHAARAGLRIAPDQIFRHQTVAELAQVTGTVTHMRAEQGFVDGPVPLTPIQHWFREQPLSRPNHWHHVLWLELPGKVDRGRFELAMQRLLQHHDALRLRFDPAGDAWLQRHGPATMTVPVHEIDAADVPDNELERALRDAADAIAADTDLANGPLVAALIATRGALPTRVAIVVHHLIVDPLSWGILLEDLDTVYAALERGEEPDLPAKTTSFKAWAEALRAYGTTDALQAQADHWLKIPFDAASIPLDRVGVFTEKTARTVLAALDTKRTRSLRDEVPGVYGTHTDEVLLTALVGALGEWTGRRRLVVGVERHGREPVAEGIDLSRTVGWFTSFFPLALSLVDAGDPGEALKSVKEQVRAVPGRGIGYGVLRYTGTSDDVCARLGEAGTPQVIFNYAGRTAFESPARARFCTLGVPVASRDPENRRSHALEVNAFMVGDRLEMHWTYSDALHDTATIEALAGRFLGELHALIDHCMAPDAGGFTPSDFPEAGLSQDELDRLLRGLGQ